MNPCSSESLQEWIPAGVNPCPPQQPRKKKKAEDQRLEKAFELLTACSNQTINGTFQHFGNTIAAKLRNCNGTVRCVIQNEIMNVFLNANSGLYERYHHTHLHLKPTSQVVHLKCTLKISIHLRTLLFHPSVLKTLLRHVLETLFRHQSVSTITQFCLTVFPQKASRQLRHFQKKILKHRCL